MELYLVTGGAGFIGFNIINKLIQSGKRVRVLDNFSTGLRENIADLIYEIELIEGDIRDLEVVRKAVDGVDYVLHQAALSSVARSIDDPVSSNEVNVNGTLNLLVAARDAQIKRFVYATSSSVYGDTPIMPKRENMTPCPLSPYAAGKLMGEHYCKIFYNLFGLETVSLRYFNVFGLRQDPLSPYSAVIPKFINAMLDDKNITIYGDGEQSRDFTYVENVVNANLLACKSPKAAGEVINIACGEQITLNQLIFAIEEELGIIAKRDYMPNRMGDVVHSYADITKAKELLGYEPVIDFYEGLKKTIEWYENSYRLSVLRVS